LTAKHRKVGVLVAAVAAAAALARPARAVDGVIEINQARALAGHVTPTDEAGFPVTIDASGSYRLTGKLTIPLTKDGIEVTAAATDVTIDLNGFAIAGPHPGSADFHDAIRGLGGAGSTVRVLNGIVRDMGENGINVIDNRGIIERVQAIGNRADGIDVGPHSTVVDCVAESNGGSGIAAVDSSIVRGCVTNDNKVGIYASPGTLLANNVVNHNSTYGIEAFDGCTVVGNNVSDNATGGILIAGPDVTLLDNTVRNNHSYGLRFDARGAYARNVITGQTDNVFGGANAIEMGTNFCGTDTTCP
jgi:parallel beta-helix repeat protein